MAKRSDDVCERVDLLTNLSQLKKRDFSLYDSPGTVSKEIRSGSQLGIEFCVFAGAGVAGLSYVGVLEALEEAGILPEIKYFIGSSSGALISALAVFGVSSSQIKALLASVDLGSMFKICGNKWRPDSFINKLTNAYYALPELIVELGVISSKEFISWLEECMIDFGIDPDITFRQLYERTGKMLVVTATCLNTYSCIYISAATYPEMRVIDALNATILIPFILQPIKFDDPSVREGERLLVDGGVTDNLALGACDLISNEGEIIGYNRRAIGFMPINNGAWYPDYVPVENVIDYGMAVIRVLHSTIHMSRSNQEHYWDRITPIECGDSSSFDFDVSEETAAKLISAGKRATEEMLRSRREMIRTKGPLPQSLFIPNLRLRCCSCQISDSLLSETLIYKQKRKTNSVPQV